MTTPEQRALEAIFRRAGAPTTLLREVGTYQLVPVLDTTTGEITYDKERKRKAFEDITYDIDRPKREAADKRKEKRKKKRQIKQNFWTSAHENPKENLFPEVRNIGRNTREIIDSMPPIPDEMDQQRRNDSGVREGVLQYTDRDNRDRLRREDEMRRAFEGTGLHRRSKRKNSGTNPWLTHTKLYAKQHRISYWDAIKDPNCKKTYRKISGGDLPLNKRHEIPDGKFFKV